MQLRRLRVSGLLALLLGAAVSPALAQTPAAIATRSYSGQFVAVPARSSEYAPVRPKPGVDEVELGETFLTISCERIKQFLLQELGLKDQWEGKVFLALRPNGPAGSPIIVGSERYRNAWRYLVELPTPVNRRLYVRAIVQVLLTELANRTATTESVEVPAWLIEGLTQQIITSRQAEIILSPPNSASYPVAFRSAFSSGQATPLRESHRVLKISRALTFDELSWPSPSTFAGPQAEEYAASAHVFTYNLLRLPTGRNSMHVLLESFSQHENWQVAFFEAFRPYFQRPLDVEKWWTLQTVHFMGRELENSWAADESQSKLREVLQVPAKVHQSSNSMPASTSLTLQTVLREWQGDQQETVMKRKIRELELLRLRVSTNYVQLTEDYRNVLLGTLARRAKAGLPFGLRRSAAQSAISAEAARELDLLDVQLEQLGRVQVANEPLAAND